MDIKRDKYLNDLINRMHNGMIKVVTGIRRCGKSYLLFNIFKNYLLEHGVTASHIITIELDQRKNKKYRDPDTILDSCSTVIDNYDSLGREQKVKLLSEACADAQWLNRMVENLLSVTRIDADGVAIQKTPTVLEELVDTVLVRFQKLHPGVPVEVKLPDDFIVIPMDSMLIQQVLTNLLENAVLHAEGMTHLTLRVFTLGRRAVFEVIDNGCGIPKEQLKRLFSGTTLAQDTSSSGRHGMGIGLSVCAAIIKAHGGEIKAESTPGEGTTIRFWLETEEVDTEETEDEQ